LTADMIQRRDDMRILLRDKYDADVEMARVVLRRFSKDSKLPLAKAALHIAKEMSAKGVDPSLMIAALVDECEFGSGK